MTNAKGGRPSKNEIVKRREQTRELFLKGKSPSQISRLLGVNYNTTLSDVQYIQARYTSLVIKNSQLAKRQMARVEQLLDEVNIVKNEYWDLYKEIQEKVDENNKKMKEWEKERKQLKKDLEIIEEEYQADPSKENRRRVRDMRKRYADMSRPPKYPAYISSRIDALKAILDRVDKEAKLLSLFNPQSLIDKNYISIDVLKSIMGIFKGIIMDLIPAEKRGYAFKRLKTIDIQSLGGDEVVDAEFTECRPKKIEPKEIDNEDGVDL